MNLVPKGLSKWDSGISVPLEKMRDTNYGFDTQTDNSLFCEPNADFYI